MMKFNLFRKPAFVISFLFILGGIGSLLFGIFPIVSSIFIILGIFASLFSLLTSESRNQELDYIVEAQATLMAQHGIGNVYTQAFKHELFKTGSVKNGLRLLEKALDVDPNDMDALSLMSSSISLYLSLQEWLRVKKDSPYFKNTFSLAQNLAKRGNELYPKNHTFCDTLGILSDLDSNHKKARQYFIRSGKLRNDPYWRLLLATSWHKSGENQKAILELKKAENDNAEGWLFNFYYGRALNSVGNFVGAENYLLLAFRERGFRPELIYEISQSYYLRGKFFFAAKYLLILSLRVLSLHLVSGIKYFLQAASYIAIALACIIAKVSWKVVRHIPFFRDLQTKILSPDEPQFTLGNLLLEKGNFKEAERNFRSCCEIISTKAENHANLALCLALQGLKDEAIKACDKSIELNPKNELFKHTRQQIESGHMKRIVDQNGRVIRIL